MKIGIFSDPHYCTKERIGTSDRYPLRSLDKMKTIVERVRSENIELLVCLGDFVNMEGSGEHSRLQVAFQGQGIKWLVAAYARLESV